VEGPAEVSAGRLAFVVAMLLGGCNPVQAQSTSPAPAQAPSHNTRVHDVALFLAGGALALGMHEAGHLIADEAFNAYPGITSVQFGPLPFFAITHRVVSPAQEYTIASAGFWVQHATSEWLLTRRPDLRRERAPLAKGVLAFNVLASVAYSGAALAHAGPAERDTRAMALSLGIDERWVGGMLLAPALLDTWRYGHPQSRWAAWMSRAAKAAMVLLVIGAAR
jgi:hypothetical protein